MSFSDEAFQKIRLLKLREFLLYGRSQEGYTIGSYLSNEIKRSLQDIQKKAKDMYIKLS